jgi:hypothetical protein
MGNAVIAQFLKSEVVTVTHIKKLIAKVVNVASDNVITLSE